MHPIVRVALIISGVYFTWHSYEMYLEKEWLMLSVFAVASLLLIYVGIVGDEGEGDELLD